MEKGEVFLGRPALRTPANQSIYRSVVTCWLFIWLLNLCLGTMADESDFYEQFSDFSYRKIITALIKWEDEKREEEERKKEEEMMETEREQQQSVIPIDKRQLVKNFFQEVNDLYPLPEGVTLNSIAIRFYQLKKEL